MKFKKGDRVICKRINDLPNVEGTGEEMIGTVVSYEPHGECWKGIRPMWTVKVDRCVIESRDKRWRFEEFEMRLASKLDTVLS